MSDLMVKCNNAIQAIEDGEASAEQVQAGIAFVDQLKATVREISERFEAAFIAWIAQNGELVDGETRYYVGPNKTTKCLDLRATVRAVLDATGGDVDAFTDCLSTSAFKPATTREVLGDAADSLFETTERLDLKTGKPQKTLHKVNDRFMKGKA